MEGINTTGLPPQGFFLFIYTTVDVIIIRRRERDAVEKH
jgi:hypothetical protein